MAQQQRSEQLSTRRLHDELACECTQRWRRRPAIDERLLPSWLQWREVGDSGALSLVSGYSLADTRATSGYRKAAARAARSRGRRQRRAPRLAVASIGHRKLRVSCALETLSVCQVSERLLPSADHRRALAEMSRSDYTTRSLRHVDEPRSTMSALSRSAYGRAMFESHESRHHASLPSTSASNSRSDAEGARRPAADVVAPRSFAALARDERERRLLAASAPSASAVASTSRLTPSTLATDIDRGDRVTATRTAIAPNNTSMASTLCKDATTSSQRECMTDMRFSN